MTEPSSSAAVGRASIDAYLDSVERALLAANAPCGERLQVLQDLESQIADMLAQQPAPLTEDAARNVIATLEPPRHFAEMYGTQQTQTPQPNRSGWTAYNRWVMVSAISCALIPVGCLLMMFAAANSVRGPVLAFMVMLLIVGCVLTPIALWKGFKQLRAEPARYLGREVALATMIGYFSTAPLLLLAAACGLTRGYVLYPLGIAAFMYLQYLLVQRVWRFMTEAVAPCAPIESVRDSSERGATAPVSFATGLSMAAL